MNIVYIGKILRPFGLNGGVVVQAFAEDPRNLKPDISVVLETGNNKEYKRLTIESVQQYKNIYRVTFREVINRTQAEQILAKHFGIEKKSLETLPENEYYNFELIGCIVRSGSGEELGQVDDVMSNPGNDLLKVVRHNKSYYVPMVKEFVLSIDCDKREIVIDPIEGLFDLD